MLKKGMSFYFKSGKSTVCSLLERFYDSDTGSITIDSIPIQSLSPNWLRSQAIGYISQANKTLSFIKHFLLK